MTFYKESSFSNRVRRADRTVVSFYAAFWLLPGAVLGQEERSPSELVDDRSIDLPDGLFASPSVQLTAIYDSNFFFDSDPVETSYYQVTPSLFAGYNSPRLQFSIGTALAAELFADDPSLNALSRKAISASVAYRTSRRMQFSFASQYTETVYPTDLDEDTGIEIGRRPSTGVSARANWSWQWARRGQWSVRYAALRADLEFLGEPSRGRLSHSAGTHWSYGITRRTSLQLNYNFQWFTGDIADPIVGQGSDIQTRSHGLSIGITRQLGRTTSLGLYAGPRLTQASSLDQDPAVELSLADRLQADIRVNFQHDWQRASLAMNYGRQQNPAFNLTGFSTTNNLAMAVQYRPHARLQLFVAPGAYRNEQIGLTTNSLRVQARASATITGWLFLTSSYNYVLQERTSVQTPAVVADPVGRSLRNAWTVSLTIGKQIPIS